MNLKQLQKQNLELRAALQHGKSLVKKYKKQEIIISHYMGKIEDLESELERVSKEYDPMKYILEN